MELTAEPPRLSFAALHERHQFDINSLALQAGVTIGVIHAMLAGRPVLRQSAEDVLRVLSHNTRRNYSLSTVEVPVAGKGGEA